jgi:hypothetical protein
VDAGAIELRESDADGIEQRVAASALAHAVAGVHDFDAVQADQQIADGVGQVRRRVQAFAQEGPAQPVAADGDEVAVAFGAQKARVRE